MVLNFTPLSTIFQFITMFPGYVTNSSGPFYSDTGQSVVMLTPLPKRASITTILKPSWDRARDLPHPRWTLYHFQTEADCPKKERILFNTFDHKHVCIPIGTLHPKLCKFILFIYSQTSYSNIREFILPETYKHMLVQHL